jgi:hypothetical protein
MDAHEQICVRLVKALTCELEPRGLCQDLSRLLSCRIQQDDASLCVGKLRQVGHVA